MPQTLKTTANYLHLQRLSTEDGPGIRTTVFLKGCSLHCAWCHNPESIPTQPLLQWLSRLCIGCESCVAACPQEALTFDKEGLRIDRDVCQLCGTCVEECPTNALEMLGSEISAEELTQELLKDRTFFATSEGGVTLSGGEPALQPDFCITVLQDLQSAGIHTALDTCCMVPIKNLERILPHVDMVMLDIKLMDAQAHKKFTGAGNERILENIHWVATYARTQRDDLTIWVRTPLIPGATADEGNLHAIAQFINENLHGLVERWELCAFNNLCRDKYQRLGMQWDYRETPLMTKGEMAACEDWARHNYYAPQTVFATGAARSEE